MVPTTQLLMAFLECLAESGESPPPGPATHYAFEEDVSSLPLGYFDANLTAVDDNGNIDPAYDGTIVFATVPPDAVFFFPGVWTLGTMGTQLLGNSTGPCLMILYDQDNPSIGLSVPVTVE